MSDLTGTVWLRDNGQYVHVRGDAEWGTNDSDRIVMVRVSKSADPAPYGKPMVVPVRVLERDCEQVEARREA